MPEFKCSSCKNLFQAKIRKNRTKRYCSKKCVALGKIKTKKESSCLTCHKKFFFGAHQKNRKFCSHKCIRYGGDKEKLGLYKGTWAAMTNEEKEKALIIAFNSVVIRKEGCWSWKKVALLSGYGSLSIGKHRSMSAHRASWKIHYGEIPKDMFVLHKCDNRICTNPDHLFLGTHLDNMRDMVSKGRQKGRNQKCPM